MQNISVAVPSTFCTREVKQNLLSTVVPAADSNPNSGISLFFFLIIYSCAPLYYHYAVVLRESLSLSWFDPLSTLHRFDVDTTLYRRSTMLLQR